jgi:hypothetical protein
MATYWGGQALTYWERPRHLSRNCREYSNRVWMGGCRRRGAGRVGASGETPSISGGSLPVAKRSHVDSLMAHRAMALFYLLSWKGSPRLAEERLCDYNVITEVFVA